MSKYCCSFSVASDLIFSRDSGWMVAVTRAHSAASSGLSRRTRRRAFGEKDVRHAVRRHSAGDLGGFGPPAPEGVEPVRPLDCPADILRNPQAVRFGPVEREV